MAIEGACSCGKRFGVKDGHAGKRIKCPGCGEPVKIPVSLFVGLIDTSEPEEPVPLVPPPTPQPPPVARPVNVIPFTPPVASPESPADAAAAVLACALVFVGGCSLLICATSVFDPGHYASTDVAGHLGQTVYLCTASLVFTISLVGLAVLTRR